jgi:mRNA deadenylase 3'-5' endonuclease subunit Ccr4
MNVTNNRGRIVQCKECQRQHVYNDNLEGYSAFTPAFADSIDSVYYGWCNVHKNEVKAMFDEAVSINQNSLMRSSGS